MVQEKSVEHRKYLENIKVYLKENPIFLLKINVGSLARGQPRDHTQVSSRVR